MAGSDDDWAANSVPWNPELPVFEPSHNLLLDAGPWTVPYSDFTPPPSPFALEMRSETIEQLVGGDALRRGESERIEAGRSEENSDAVAGRDRVRVQGTLHEHTGHGLAEQAAHLHTTVDGTLDVHAGNEDMVLLAGHMKDVWDGGTAIVAAMTDDTVAGGGIRVTTPLDLWMHGLMGVEERIGTCTADAVLVELGATHYEREYGPGVHAAGLAVYNGSLYLSNRSSFRPLMRVSSGVRNLIAGGGGAGGDGGAPDASSPPAPAAGGAGTEAASETLSAANGSTRTVEAVVDAGAHTDDLTGAHRFSNATDAVRPEDLAAVDQVPAARLDDLPDSLRRAGDETGDQAGTGSPSSAGSDSRVPQEGVELSDTQMDFFDEILHTFETRLAAESGDTSLLARSDDPSGLSRSADTAEQLAALQRGDMNPASLESIVSPTPSGMDDAYGSSDLSRAGTPAPGRDRTPLDPARFEGNESVPSMEIPEPLEIPPDRGFVENSSVVWTKYIEYRRESAWFPLIEYTRAVNSIDSRVREAYRGFVGPAADLSKFGGHEGTVELYKLLGELATRADGADDARRAAEIREALAAIDQFTYKLFTDLAARANDFDGTSVWMAQYRRLDPAIDDIKLSNWIQEQIEAMTLEYTREYGDVDGPDDALEAGVELSYKTFYLQDMKSEVILGRDPTFQSQFMIAYLSETGNGDQAGVTIEVHNRLVEAMADPAMQRTGAAVVSVRPGLASLPLYDRSGNFLHVPGFAYASGSNANRVDDVHGAVHAAGVAGSVPEIPRPTSAGSLSSSQGITPPGAKVPMTESEFEFGFGSSVHEFGSSVSEESHSRASLTYSLGGSVPATPVVGVAPRLGLDAHAASWPVLEDAFRLTDDLELLPGLQRADEPLSDVPRGLDESYSTTDFATFRRIDDAPADAPDEIGPRTDPPSEWPGGRSGTSSGPEGIGFGHAEVEGASPPGQQAGETAGFGRSELPLASNVQFSDRARILRQLMDGKRFSVEDADLLRFRFEVAARSGGIDRWTRQSEAMMDLLGVLTFLAKSPGIAEEYSARLSNDNWQALEHLLSLLDTPRRRS